MDHEKHQKEIIGDNQDLISQLPDDILVNMLSLLTLKEAGQTSMLSPRWRYLWTSCPNLIFDASKIIYELMYNDDYKYEYEKLRENYMNWVDQVVLSYTGPSIHDFMVQFGLDNAAKTHIDQWIHFAFKLNVQRLTLDLVGDSHHPYSFPDITEAGAFHHILHGRTSSRSLTSLKLMYVNITGEVLQFLLSASPLLECLLVHSSMTLSNLELRSTLLKSLDLQFCIKLTTVSVTAPNLVSFTYSGHVITLELSCIPKLTNMSLGGSQCDHFIYNNPVELFNYFSLLEVLTLDIMEYNGDLTNFPGLARLKRLKVLVDPEKEGLIGFATVLKACPALCELSFEFYGSKFQPTTSCSEVVATCPHHSLKVVELAGFFGSATDHLALYLIKNAVMLERIIFDTREPGYKGTPKEFKETKRREPARRSAKHLAKSLRPGVTSVII